jgi:uncharacterized protein (TIGR02001 family)
MNLSKTLLASALVAASGIAQAELSATLGVASNYYFRGVTQTDDNAAVSGSLDFASESGFYLGTWMSNVDFGGKEDMEVDFYAGYAGDIGDSGFGYDLSALYYWYPGAGGDDQGGELDYTEVSGTLSYGPVAANIAYTVDSEYGDDDSPFIEGDIYYGLSADIPVDFEGFGLGVFVGYYDFDADGDKCCGDLSYTHWGASVSKDAGDFGAFSMNYEQTDGGDDNGVASDDNPNFWIGWSKDF